jgi:hypothetical protein
MELRGTGGGRSGGYDEEVDEDGKGNAGATGGGGRG